ncbi:MAG: hypothetical protein U9N50_07905, partial [Pseudomonadota bacterium]|nr:hypothetical protein [Pseudomonadota bacterium]
IQNQRKAAPLCRPSATLRASVWTGHGELAITQTCTALFRPSLPVLDNPKGDERSKTKNKRLKTKEEREIKIDFVRLNSFAQNLYE